MNIPREKASRPILSFDPSKLSSILRIYIEVSHLRNIYRRGWLKRGLPEFKTESDADHSFMFSFLTMMLVEQYYPHLDPLKVIKMVLVHETPEAIEGDHTPGEDGEETKYEREKKAVEQIFAHAPFGQEYISLWEEFEAGETEEAKLVRQLDKLEPMLLSVIYQLQNPDLDFREFLANAEEKISDPILLDLVAECRLLIK